MKLSVPGMFAVFMHVCLFVYVAGGVCLYVYASVCLKYYRCLSVSSSYMCYNPLSFLVMVTNITKLAYIVYVIISRECAYDGWLGAHSIYHSFHSISLSLTLNTSSTLFVSSSAVNALIMGGFAFNETVVILHSVLPFISFRFISFHFISFPCISFPFIVTKTC
jgi:hypothetical protein